MLKKLLNRLRRVTVEVDGSLHRDVHFGRIEGWAWARGTANEPLSVRLLADGEPFAETATLVSRPDVVKAGRSDHACVGFRYYLPEAFYDGVERRLGAELPAYGFELKRSPISARLGDTLTHPGELCGLLTPVMSMRVRGWVLWGGARSHPLEIAAYEDGRPLAAMTANAPRRDIAAMLPGARRCGFSFSLPDRFLEPGERTLSVREAGTGLDIPGSPQVLDGMVLRATIEARIERNLAQVDRSFGRLRASGALRPEPTRR